MTGQLVTRVDADGRLGSGSFRLGLSHLAAHQASYMRLNLDSSVALLLELTARPDPPEARLDRKSRRLHILSTLGLEDEHATPVKALDSNGGTLR